MLEQFSYQYSPFIISPNQTNLNSFINIEAQPGGVTEKEDDNDGEEQGNHGGVSAVVVGDGVVQCCGSKILFSLVKFIFSS